MPKPPLGPLAVGDRLILIPAPNRWRPKSNAEVEVVKKGRVWVDLRQVGADPAGAFTANWRMRLDTQDEGHRTHIQARFVTAEQLAWEQRINGASEVLRAAKVIPRDDSPWHRDEDRLLALAEFVRAYDAEHPA